MNRLHFSSLSVHSGTGRKCMVYGTRPCELRVHRDAELSLAHDGCVRRRAGGTCSFGQETCCGSEETLYTKAEASKNRIVLVNSAAFSAPGVICSFDIL